VDPFALIVIGGIVLVVLVFLALGFWHPARAMEITDQDRHERWATQAEIEESDVDEMVEGQNTYRRARGESDLAKGEFEQRAAARQRESIERAEDR
jgi:FtsZ-interacting cell division protein ZipA